MADTVESIRDMIKSKIEENTKSILADGFIFEGEVYSLEREQQIRLLASQHLKDDNDFNYPLKWRRMRSMSFTSLPDSAKLKQFFKTASGTYKFWLDEEQILMTELKSLTTVEELRSFLSTIT